MICESGIIFELARERQTRKKKNKKVLDKANEI